MSKKHNTNPSYQDKLMASIKKKPAPELGDKTKQDKSQSHGKRENR